MAYTPGKGTVIKLSISSVYTTISQVTGITAPSIEMGLHETTHLTSTTRTRQADIIDPGEVSFTIEWDAALSTHAQLWTSFQNGTDESWKIIYADAGAAEVAFTGIIKSFPIGEASVDNVVTMQVTIQVTGLPVLTP